MNMLKETKVTKIVKEDILRIIGERKRKVSLAVMEKEIKTSPSFISKAIEELEKEQLIQSKGVFFELTRKGQKEAKDILDKHFVCENYFRRSRNDLRAHEIAHILEHYVSQEVINNIIKMSTFKNEGIPLTKLKQHRKKLITDIMISDDALFERLVSMGIVPGENVMVINELPNATVVRIKEKKFALDRNIARKIKVLEYEES